MDKTIYHYDSHEGFYLGPEQVPAGYPLPFCATDISPPTIEQWPPGSVPVFCADTSTWGFAVNAFWQVKIEERNFYSGRDSDGPVYLVAHPASPGYQTEVMKYSGRLPAFNLPRIGPCPSPIHLSQRIDFINTCTQRLEAYWRETRDVPMPFFGGGPNHYHFLTECLVGAIRRLLDDLTTAIFLVLFQRYEPWKRNLVIDGVTDFLGKKARVELKKFFVPSEKGPEANRLCEQLITTILGGNFFFLKALQELSNAYKHAVTTNLVRPLYGRDHPTILAVGTADRVPNCNLGRLVYHNHSLRQLLIGLTDYLHDLLERLNGPCATSSQPQRCDDHLITSTTRLLNAPYGTL